MNDIESLIGKSSPGNILSPNFILRLEVLIKNTGKSAMKNPFGAAAGLAMVAISAFVLLAIATGRTDLFPEIISSFLRVMGGI
jgi:hypothetical protein